MNRNTRRKKQNNRKRNNQRPDDLRLGDHLYYNQFSPNNSPKIRALVNTTQKALSPYFLYLTEAIKAEEKRGQYEVMWEQIKGKVVIELEPKSNKYRIDRLPPNLIIDYPYEELKEEKNRLFNDTNDSHIITFSKEETVQQGNGFKFKYFENSIPNLDDKLELNGQYIKFHVINHTITSSSKFSFNNSDIIIDDLIENESGWDIIVSQRKLGKVIFIDGAEYRIHLYNAKAFERLYDGNKLLDFEKIGNQYHLQELPKENVLKSEDGDEYFWQQRNSQQDFIIQLKDSDDDDSAKPVSDYFFDDGVEEIYQGSNKNTKIRIKHKNSEEKTLVLAAPYKQKIQLNKNEPIRIAVNTTVLKRQRDAIKSLNDSPVGAHKNLIKLFESKDHSQWESFNQRQIESWYVLTDPNYDGTDAQRSFVQKAVSTPEFAILEGPPGSGKTTAIIELILQLAKDGKRILLSASTHVAIDNVLERIGYYDTDNIIEPLRIGDEGRIADAVAHLQIQNKIEKLKESGMQEALAERFVLDSANLVCGTTMGIQQHPQIKNRDNSLPAAPLYDYLIIDESSKTTFQEFIVPALYAKKWILVGDIKQLSPYIEQSHIVHNFNSLVEDDMQYALKLIFHTLTTYGSLNPYIIEVNVKVIQHIDSYLSAWQTKDNNPYMDVVVCSLTRTSQNLKTILSIQPDKNALLLFGSNLILVEKGHYKDFASYLPKTHIFLNQNNIVDPFLFEQSYLHKKRLLPRYNNIGSERVEQNNPYAASQKFKQVFDEKSWAEEIAWRMIRVYERRMLKKKDSYYEKSYDLLKPFAKDNMVDRLYNMTLPSILESIQVGNGEKHKDSTVITEGFDENIRKQRHIILNYQHRMHPDISKFSRDEFYTSSENIALLDGNKTQRDWDYNRYTKRAVWIDTPKSESAKRQDRTHFDEANRIIKEIEQFLGYSATHKHPEGKEWTIAVITYYRPQETLLRKKLCEFCSQPNKISRFFKNGVSILLYTVDKFQGMEADMVFISMVRGKSIGFMDNINRLNVALTRAKYQRVIVGDIEFFRKQKNSEELKRLADTSERLS